MDFIQLGLLRGLSLEEAILESVSVRLRPILLTSGAAVLGAIPITLDTVFGGMAWSLIFGLDRLDAVFAVRDSRNVQPRLREQARPRLAREHPQEASRQPAAGATPREADRIESAYDTLDKTRRAGCAVLLSGRGRGTAFEPGMSLREAVEYALAHSPDLKSSQTEVARRQGLVTTARSFLMPQVDLSADAARSRYEHGYPSGTTPSLLRFDTAIYTGSADLKFLAWDFHKTELELAATRERVEAARATVDRRRQEIVFETARLYLQTLAYSDLIGAAEARIKSLQSLLDRTNQLVKGGRAVPVDALKIQTRLAQVESDLATLRSGRRSSLSALAAVMGFEGDLPQLSYTPASSELPPLAGTGKRIAAPGRSGPAGDALAGSRDPRQRAG